MKQIRVSFLAIFLVLAATVSASALDEKLAGQVLAEINLARTAPATYAGYIRAFRSRFRGKVYSLPGSAVSIQTREGKAAVDEASRYLSRRKPLPQLSWSDGLAAAAAGLAEDQGRSGATGHVDSQGKGVKERIELQGKWAVRIAENIGYGPGEARQMVMQLIIDDGVKGRGHRKNIFSKAFTTAGVACGPHPAFGTMCVIDFAGGFSK